MTKIRANTNDNAPRIESLVPDAVLPGGEVELRGENLGPVEYRQPQAFVGAFAAPILLSRSRRMVVRIPEAAISAALEVRLNGSVSNLVDLRVAQLLATDVHPVTNPAIDAEGNLYTTLSGSRGQKTPISLYRITAEGDKEPFLTGIMNATGVTVDSSGYIYVSSRHEGTVYRVTKDGASSVYAEGMGIATGLAFDADGNLYVGDRSGTIFKISRDRQIFVFATLEPSVSAYHLAFGQDGTLFISAPTTSSNECIWAVDRSGATHVYYRGLGRPQGLAVDTAGNIFVAASFQGKRGLVRIAPNREAQLVVSGQGIVGLAFAEGGGAMLTTNNAVYYVDLGVEGLRFY
jgi:sugar lactone lactonase YvrE